MTTTTSTGAGNGASRTATTPPTAWKRLALAGLGGYLLAVVTFLLLENNNGNNGNINNNNNKIENSISHWNLSSMIMSNNKKSSSFERILEQEQEQMVDDEQEQGSEEGEEEIDDFTMDTSVTCIVLFLIFLTIAFEKVKHHVLHTADRNFKPTIEALFGEMTVLGFVSAISFTLSQVGFFSVLSEHFFQEEEVLLEVFEFVHYFLFLIMVFYMGFVLLLVREASQMEHEWRKMDKACKDPLYMMKVMKNESSRRLVVSSSKSQTPSAPKSWPRYLYKSLLRRRSFRFEKGLQLFHGLRQEFLLERDGAEAPFVPAAVENRVDESFHFGGYLNICLGHTLENIVEVYPVTWCCFVVLTLLYYASLCLVGSNDWAFAWIWALSGWAMFFFGNYFDYHIETLLYALAAHMEDGHPTSCSTSISDAKLLETGLPAWCQVDLEKYKKSRSFLTKWISPSPPTRRDSLYWMEKEGPRLYLIIFQFRTVFLSAYYALLFLSFYPVVFQEASVLGGIGYVIFSIIPAVLLKLPNRRSVSNMAIAANLGDHRRPHFVSKAIRSEKTEQIIRSLVIIEKLQRAASQTMDESFIVPGGQHHHEHSAARRTIVDREELAEVARIFNTFDASGDGAIQTSELEQLLIALGVDLSKQSLNAMVKQLDTDGDGEISRDEFLAFYASSLSDDDNKEGGGHRNLHELGRFIFQLFDRDGSGGVTLSEFKAVLDALNVGFDIDEIGELVNELDEGNHGTVREKNFIELLERNAHLFEELELPPIACVIDGVHGMMT